MPKTKSLDSHSPLKEYPCDIISGMRDFTGQSELFCHKVIESAIKSRETTNDPQEIRNWMSNHFVPNTVIMCEDDYEEVFADSLMTIFSQKMTDFGGKQRKKADAIENKIGGYLAEKAIVKLAKNHGVHFELAHEQGNPEDFYATDFPKIKKEGRLQAPKFNMGAKGSGSGALWFEISHSQFVRSDFHIFAKSVFDGDHFFSYMLEGMQPKLNYLSKKGLISSQYIEMILESSRFKTIPIYVVGWVENNELRDEFEYKGVMKTKNYTINEYKGLLTRDYQNIVRKREGLNKESKVKFLSINEFDKSRKSDLQVFNLGSFKKTPQQFNHFFNKF